MALDVCRGAVRWFGLSVPGGGAAALRSLLVRVLCVVFPFVFGFCFWVAVAV